MVCLFVKLLGLTLQLRDAKESTVLYGVVTKSQKACLVAFATTAQEITKTQVNDL